MPPVYKSISNCEQKQYHPAEKWHDQNWKMMYEQLIQYKEIYGNCCVPRSYCNNLKLAKWVNHQRTMYKNGNLTNERAEKLKELGFVFRIKPPTKSWFEMFVRLLKYIQEHGDSLVPQRYKGDPQLGKWVNTQRTFYSNGTLSADHTTILESVGFVFDKLSLGWDDMYNRLIKYKQTYGDTNVPCDYKDDKQLPGWISRQRLQYNKGTIDEIREDRLNSIGFVWSARDHNNRKAIRFRNNKVATISNTIHNQVGATCSKVVTDSSDESSSRSFAADSLANNANVADVLMLMSAV